MPRPRPPHVVLAAWIVTGPLGHLYGGLADWISVLALHARERTRGERG